jgi:riboflavin synthase
MFTGIIEEVGTLRRSQRQGQTLILTFQAKYVLDHLKLGDSISVNGVCLTVVSFDSQSFSVECVPETVRKTSLKQLQPSSPVNLERAMIANGRFGGHIVQGHVDATATIISKKIEENAVVFRLQPHNRDALNIIVPTGSIAVDGISLTVVEVTHTWFSIYTIPHTLAQTALMFKQVGDIVNVECDVLGKYIQKLLTVQPSALSDHQQHAMTKHFLNEHGYMSE